MSKKICIQVTAIHRKVFDVPDGTDLVKFANDNQQMVEGDWEWDCTEVLCPKTGELLFDVS